MGSVDISRHSLTISLYEFDRENEFLAAVEYIIPPGWTRALDIEQKAAPILREKFFLRSFRRARSSGIPRAIISLSLIGPSLFGVAIRSDHSHLEGDLSSAQHNALLECVSHLISFVFVDFDWAFALKTSPGEN